VVVRPGKLVEREDFSRRGAHGGGSWVRIDAVRCEQVLTCLRRRGVLPARDLALRQISPGIDVHCDLDIPASSVGFSTAVLRAKLMEKVALSVRDG
jgi:hypothetical protein